MPKRGMDQGDDTTPGPLFPMARSTDPATSHEAADVEALRKEGASE